MPFHSGTKLRALLGYGSILLQENTDTQQLAELHFINLVVIVDHDRGEVQVDKTG